MATQNWPELIASCKAMMIPGEHFTSEQRNNIIRKQHGNIIITVSDGTSYIPPGGIVSSGICIYDIFKHDMLMENLMNWEELVRKNEKNFRNALKISGNDKLSIKLIIDYEQRCWLYEPDKKIKFDLIESKGEPWKSSQPHRTPSLVQERHTSLDQTQAQRQRIKN